MIVLCRQRHATRYHATLTLDTITTTKEAPNEEAGEPSVSERYVVRSVSLQGSTEFPGTCVQRCCFSLRNNPSADP